MDDLMHLVYGIILPLHHPPPLSSDGNFSLSLPLLVKGISPLSLPHLSFPSSEGNFSSFLFPF